MKTTKDKTVSITFRTTQELKDKLSALAKKDNRNMSNLIETLLNEAITARKK